MIGIVIICLFIGFLIGMFYGRHHYNNGVIEICVKEPPLGSEWKPGRLKRIKEV